MWRNKPIYFEDRYPYFSNSIPADRYSKEEAKEIIENAKTVLKWIKKNLN